MNTYRFEISCNGFSLHVRYSTTEESGTEWCRRYMSSFQRKVANVELRVKVFEREKKKHIWEYYDTPYLYKKTLVKKPLVNKAKDK